MRDGIRAAGINYDQATCEIMGDELPPPRCGNFFVSIHSGFEKNDADNQLNLWCGFSVTLTMRVTLSLDRVGDQQMARNVNLVPLAQRLGFNAKCDQLRNLLHMNWNFVTQTGKTPNSANDNLKAWCTGTVYGFCEPMRYGGREFPKLVGDEWFQTDSGGEKFGMKSTLMFERCRRLQPVTAPSGPFV